MKSHENRTTFHYFMKLGAMLISRNSINRLWKIWYIYLKAPLKSTWSAQSQTTRGMSKRQGNLYINPLLGCQVEFNGNVASVRENSRGMLVLYMTQTQTPFAITLYHPSIECVRMPWSGIGNANQFMLILLPWSAVYIINSYLLKQLFCAYSFSYSTRVMRSNIFYVICVGPWKIYMIWIDIYMLYVM